MGRTNYDQIGYGLTETDARRDALDRDRDYYGHQEGYSGSMCSSTGEDDRVKCLKQPKPAKRCKVNKNIHKGTRKWVTVYTVEPACEFKPFTRNDCVMCGSTQAEALKEAKRLALKNQIEYIVRIDKVLVSGTTKIATVTPDKSELGKWLFTGVARS